MSYAAPPTDAETIVHDEEPTGFEFPWRVLLLFVLWWFALQGFALLSFNRFRLSEPDQAYTWTSQIENMLPMPWRGFVDLHARFDSGFYTWIAGEGYTRDNAAFLPLYPVLIKLVVTAVSCAPLRFMSVDCFATAAFLISNLSALLAALVLYALARLDTNRDTAERAVFYFLIFPTAFFLTANYTESLFVLLAASSFLAARRGHWLLASSFGALAMLTRPSALALFAALLVETWTQRRPLNAIWLLLMPLTFVAFLFYLNANGLSFFDTQTALFGRTPLKVAAWENQLDWQHLQAQPAAQVNFALDVGLALFVLLVSLVSTWQWRASYGVFGALCVLLPALTIQTISLDRYALVAFNVPLLLARYGQHACLDRAYTLSAILLLALYTILFVQGYWAG